MPRIGLATCRAWPEVSASDAVLGRALERRGARVAGLPWNDPAAAFGDLDAVILRSCWDYHHDLDGFLAWIAGLERAGRAVWNPPPLVRWNASKRYLLDLAAAGVPTPETVVLGGGADLPGLMDARGWARAVVKPMVSASAHDTTLVARAEAEAVGRALDAGAIRRPALLQPFLEEIGARGEWSVVFVDGEPTHAVLKRPAPGEFRVQPRLGGTSALGVPPPGVAAAARRALAAAGGDPLYARVDVVEAASAVLLMELELIEPGLFLAEAPAAADRLADALLARVRA